MNITDQHIEIIKDRFYFAITNDEKFSNLSDEKFHYFTTDEYLVYIKFFEDFGPLCLSAVYKYCKLIHKKLKTRYLLTKKIVHYTNLNLDNGEENKVNAAFLVGSYMILELRKKPKEVFERLTLNSRIHYVPFRDASYGPSIYDLPLLDCLNGFYKAVKLHFFSMRQFNLIEYEHYEKVENGDFNWIVPNKFLAFCGPHSIGRKDRGHIQHTVDSYIEYFKSHNITNVIQLNRKSYDANLFVNQDIKHHDLYFPDGTSPNDKILKKFIRICETATGAIAVHCKAGLGRTGTLISCYLMKHYRMTAKESIAWIRIARPGSIIGPQQHYLESKEKDLWLEGEVYKKNLVNGLNASLEMPIIDMAPENNTESEEEAITQGDKLNMIKQNRISKPLKSRRRCGLANSKKKLVGLSSQLTTFKSVRQKLRNKSSRSSKIVTRSKKY